MVMFGCSFSNSATSSSHSLRSFAAVVGGSQLTVIVVGALTSRLAGAADGESELDDAGLELELPPVLGLPVSPVAFGLLLLQPAIVTTPAAASTATHLWYFIERIPPGAGDSGPWREFCASGLH